MPIPINIEDLLHKRKIESNRIDFKKGWNPDSIYRSICAFANDFDNIGGGYIVVGVEEENGMAKRPVAGIPIDSLDRIQKDMIGYNNKIDPYYMPRVDMQEVDGKYVLVIWAPAGLSRPYSVWERVTVSKSPYKWYVRSGSNSIAAKGDVLDELREMANRVPFDERGNENIQITDISPTLVLDYLQTVNSRLASVFDKTPFTEILNLMDLFTGPTEQRLLKNVAAMMFCKNPAKFFPVTQVDIVIFPDGCIENPNNMTEVPKIVGSVPEMIKQTLDYFRTNVIKKNIIKPKDRAESITFFNYPYQAIEESVVNALYHRDYQEREPVEITIEPDKISILNYGGPDRSITMDAIHRAERLKSRRYRNRRLGDYFKELQLSEGRGTGIPTIQDELRKNGSSPAVIETNNDRTYFLIEIPCREGFGKTIEPLYATLKKALNGVLNDKELAVFMEIAKSPNIKRKTLLEKMDISKATLERAVKQLSSESLNLIEHKGSKRYGGYVLTEKGESILEDNTMIL
ncbi:MAG: putative DNA binding domain-containing protein [Prevotella sp.]|nr:putative DNA binding domain-containing protein [Prevotella sp.]